MSSPSHRPDPIVRFAIEAFAAPDILPRVLQPFAKRGLVPTRSQSRVIGERLTILLELHGMASDEARRIAAGLRQIIGIEAVVTAARAAPTNEVSPAEGAG